MAKAEDGHWMEKAFSKNKGKLHRRLGVSPGKKIPEGKLKKAEKSDDPTLRKEANLAEIGRKYGGKKRSAFHKAAGV